MRARPAVSFEYLGETAVGKVALLAPIPVVAGVRAGLATPLAVFSEALPAAAGASAEGALADAGAAVAVAPHSALRKSFHLMPLALPLAWAALYLSLHSFMVKDCAEGIGIAQTAIAAAAA